MASRSGRRGEFPPDSKEMMESSMKIPDAPLDDDATGPAAEEQAGKRQPRRMLTTTATISAAGPDVCAPAPAKSGAAKGPKGVPGIPTVEEGCKVCKRDIDHPNLLLCEMCNDEYHTYCLNPPLQSVPEGDFFCGEFLDVAHS